MKTNVKYFAIILLLGFGVFPFIVSFGAVFLSGIGRDFLPFVYSAIYIAAAFVGARLITRKSMPENFLMRYLPVTLPLLVTLIAWAVCMVVSGGFYGHSAFAVFGALQIAYFPMLLVTSLMGMLSLMFYLPLCYSTAFLIFFTLFERKNESPKPIHKRFVSVCAVLIIVSSGVGAYVTYERTKTVLPPNYGFQYGGGYASVDIYRYDVMNENNILPKLSEPSVFFISDIKKMPVLDGAEAAYPVYSVFANGCYDIDAMKKALEQEGKYNEKFGAAIIRFTNTIYAFERLLSGDVDIFFGAEPSKAQREMAQRAGKKLVLTPIGKEAFVFFVNKDNLCNNLTADNIKSIYSGEIKNWQSINGVNEKVIAFQRPENSGSQTIMQNIMGDTPLAPPLKEEYVSGMGGISENVADYRNYPGAIGYSFRFFTMGMADNSDKIKLLSIDDIDPSAENIKSSAYPYTVSLYAITLEDNKLDTIQPFLEWMQGKQGQELVEKIGYITLED